MGSLHSGNGRDIGKMTGSLSLDLVPKWSLYFYAYVYGYVWPREALP